MVAEQTRSAAVRKVGLPLSSTIADWFDDADLADAFAISLPVDATRDIDALARAVLGDPAPWFRALMALRDVMVLPFGVKSSAQVRRETHARAAAHIDFFPIISCDVNEMIVGENDRHLDFRASLLLRPVKDARHELIATTMVRCHSRFGHLYLFFIGPFHRLVVRSGLRRAAARGWPNA